VLVVRPEVDRLARLGGEDPAAATPELSGGHTLVLLLDAVLAEKIDERSRQADHTPACPRLRLGGDGINVPALWAVARPSPA
jgi:hypothetical protein